MNSGGSRDWASASPYERFFDFIAPDADRFAVLFDHIQKLGLNSVVIPIEGNRHFFVFPKGKNLKPSTGGSFPFRRESPVILTAHYDRVPGSPGANDNSAAVFQLLGTALQLDKQGVDYWIVIFTDKEELKTGEGIQNQGSFSLAKKLRGMALHNARIFNFDACGTGDTFVFSTTVDHLVKKNKRPEFQRASRIIYTLRDKAFDAARNLNISQVMSVPTPFSDDAGFLQGGIPVQTVTVLPSAEARLLSQLLRSRLDFIDLLITGAMKNSAVRQSIPETWRCLNSPSDSHLRLTPEHYDRIIRFAVELCRG
ncbi:MAG: M28 family metallopeptidase [Treponema sp.]|nr:M28 family metallopeptidase [Treponema sp.]